MSIMLFVLIVASRLVVPLWIPRFPLPAIILTMVLDGIDGGLLERFTSMSEEGYQSYDKALDIYYLTIAYLAAIRNWTNPVAVRIAMALFYYRLVGVLLFEFFESRALLFIFANTFEYVFIAYEVARLRWDMNRLSRNTLLGAVAAIWIVIKLPQEYWLHIAQRDVSDTLAATPVLIPILAVVIAVVIGIGHRIVTQKMPPADHSLSLAVENAIPLVTMKTALLRYRSLSWHDQGLVEKVVLIALISAKFSMMLPETTLSTLQLMIGVAVVVILNAFVSELLTRRGLLSFEDIRHFASMVGVNMVLAAIFLALLPAPDGPIRLGNLLFFFFLVSLLVTLFDRFRALAIMRDDAEPRGTLP